LNYGSTMVFKAVAELFSSCPDEYLPMIALHTSSICVLIELNLSNLLNSLFASPKTSFAVRSPTVSTEATMVNAFWAASTFVLQAVAAKKRDTFFVTIFRMYPSHVISKTIETYYKLKSFRKCAKLMNVSKSTIHRWVKHIGVRRRNQKHRRKKKRKLSGFENDIVRLLTTKPFTRLSSLSTHFVHVSKSTMSRFLKSIKFGWKRAKSVMCGSPKPEQVQQFQESIASLDFNDVICIDETSINNTMIPYYGYFRKGRQVDVKIRRSSKTRVRMTVLCAISINGVVAWKIIPKACNGDIYSGFLEQFESKTLLMDNVSFHKTRKCRQVMADRNCSPLFIPPYSPKYNPIEEFFSQFKGFVRSKLVDDAMTAEDVLKVVVETLEKLREQSMEGYYRHSFATD